MARNESGLSHSAHTPCRWIQAGRFDIPQGIFVALVGPRGEGKSTFLRLLGGAILPKIDETTMFFLPSHLRCLHVSGDPLFFIGTLLENLSFGANAGDKDIRLERVLRICDRLKMGKAVVDIVASEEIHVWSRLLSHTQSHLLSLARALITNPECLFIHKPTQAFDDLTANIVVEMLQEYVKQKGVEQDAATYNLRRPRTCISTSAKTLGAEVADKLYYVSVGEGVCEISKSQLTSDMLG
eukprot:gnl/TRDRNA2_/TRDRNA2_137222_c1_seq1.p1 gnl/TRDRNA2_/TRDRNA2_137222_c1~~gnl/TRDRNA2_/TRDRNA2_137222_c1_seq1.p1  ORF type:complete len:240 (+),score=26.85 gnl/TRDRNA2_/TRDRNA2_137222_c1_seq1:80-799(+)